MKKIDPIANIIKEKQKVLEKENELIKKKRKHSIVPIFVTFIIVIPTLIGFLKFLLQM